MSGFFMHTIEIKEYNKFLIIKLVKQTPKLRPVGAGMALINFNKNDLFISESAADILRTYTLLQNSTNTLDQPVLEIMSDSSLWYMGTQGLIIPPGEIIHVYAMPHFTVCDNDIDEVLKNTLDKAKIH
jgi:hypothetical protein